MLCELCFHEGENTFDVIVVENAIMQRGAANEVFHDLKAVVKLVCQLTETPLIGLSPTRVKKLFTGSGKAEKTDIINKVLDMGIELPYRIMKAGPDKGKKRYSSDAADAVAIWQSFKIEEGLL